MPADSKQVIGHPYRRADVGEYRVIYSHNEDRVRIVLIGKRNDDEVYRDLKRMN
jgi:mRNA interferase RelE/StbE